jgi:uncharacterized protein (DUF983 family)
MNEKDKVANSAEKIKKPTASRVALLRIKENNREGFAGCIPNCRKTKIFFQVYTETNTSRDCTREILSLDSVAASRWA